MEHQAVYERLVRAARAREFVHYGELAKMLDIDMDNPHFGALVGKVLGQISEDEVAAGRPMISAIVVSRGDMLPGKGFYKLGQELHKGRPGAFEFRARTAGPARGSAASYRLERLASRPSAGPPSARLTYR